MAKNESSIAKWLREAVGMQPYGTGKERRNIDLRAKQINRELEKAGVPSQGVGEKRKKKKPMR